jgi:hypothetical protein
MAADERARALQAKKDEQPANTARSYAAKQREWKARSPGRRPLFSLLPLPLSLRRVPWAANRRELIGLVPYASGCGRRLTL